MIAVCFHAVRGIAACDLVGTRMPSRLLLKLVWEKFSILLIPRHFLVFIIFAVWKAIQSYHSFQILFSPACKLCQCPSAKPFGCRNQWSIRPISDGIWTAVMVVKFIAPNGLVFQMNAGDSDERSSPPQLVVVRVPIKTTAFAVSFYRICSWGIVKKSSAVYHALVFTRAFGALAFTLSMILKEQLIDFVRDKTLKSSILSGTSVAWVAQGIQFLPTG